MTRFSVFLLLVLVIVGCAFAKPADEPKKEVAPVVEKKADDKTSTAVSSVSGWSTYLSEGNTWPILSGTLAALFIVGGLGLGVYYFYYLTYFGAAVQQQAQSVGAQDTYSNYNAPGYTNYGNYPYQTSVGRSIKGGNSFSFDRVLDMIAMAQELYEKFDFQSLDCQKKALCELQQRTGDFGETGRQIQGTLSFYVSRSFVEALEDLPMPKVIQTYMKEYKEALIQGKNSSKDCGTMYPKCSSSVRDVFVKYSKKVQKI